MPVYYYLLLLLLLLLTGVRAVLFVGHIATVIVTVTDVVCTDTATVVAVDLIVTTLYGCCYTDTSNTAHFTYVACS